MEQAVLAREAAEGLHIRAAQALAVAAYLELAAASLCVEARLLLYANSRRLPSDLKPVIPLRPAA